jgi:serine/threonine-protein kinase
MSTTLTGTGTVMGTTPYLSPEQVAGRSVDARSDQYTLGVILYECATGRRPHEGENIFAIMRSIADGRFRRPRELRPDLSPAFEAVILRAMHHDPAPRFESVHALGRALLPFASERRRLIWSEYYGADSGGKPMSSMPRTEPLPEPRVAAFAEPLDSTRTGDRRSYPRVAENSAGMSELRPRSKGPWVFLVMVLLAGGGFGAYLYTREPPQVRPVEVKPTTTWQPPKPPVVEPAPVVDPRPPVVTPAPTPVTATPTTNPRGGGKGGSKGGGKHGITGRDPRPPRPPKAPEPKPPILPAPILD